MEASDPEVMALVNTINDDPDELHGDFTPSVVKLMTKGVPAAKAVIPLLDSPEWETRLRAYRVLEGVVKIQNGWIPGRGFAGLEEQARAQAVLEANGSYRADMNEAERKGAIEKWQRWAEEHSQ